MDPFCNLSDPYSTRYGPILYDLNLSDILVIPTLPAPTLPAMDPFCMILTLVI